MKYPDFRFRPKQQVLTDEQLEAIHSATLEILESVGIKITHGEAKALLHDAGAKVDGDMVKIPAWMVEDAIRKAPPRVVLGNRKGERTVNLEGDKTFFGPSLDCMEYLNPDTNERRPFRLEDCRTTSRVADALPYYDWVMTINVANDVSEKVADRYIAKQVLTNTKKPYVFCCNNKESLRDIYEMALLICGGEDKFQQAPLIAQFTQPIAPLVHYDSSVDKLMFCAEKGIPLIYYSSVMCGGTAPMTYAGALAQGSAESLSGLVIAQLVKPGASFVYGSFTTIIDMKTTIHSYAAPEMSLMTAAMTQMAQRYQLPFFGSAGCADAKFPDAQAAAEAAISCFSSFLIGSNLIHDSGWLDHGTVASPAYMVLVHEIIEMIDHYMTGIDIDEEHLAVETIRKTGPGAQYLTNPHTFKHCRKAWYSDLFERKTWDAWLGEGSVVFDERLREKTLKLMQHEPEPLASDMLTELENMQKKWK
ncbi:trimethylamine methyltransferase MttB [Desulfosarcina widdelii]|uniref:Trimethylamine methyltransferase MttB n=1 Tax=Desulfosarcina widdelii TaxID=947919 RepID=A0A5K7Z193_9BACT|nr:trimethylamine methyltransferase family protein [Desulfosarcina widdelii]BBO73251.1 trimethylamine methyltransferase MttB [Desulfosarcina widdelii]